MGKGLQLVLSLLREDSQRGHPRAYLEGPLFEPLFSFWFLPFHYTVYRATPSNQLGKGHGARENSLPLSELWGKLRQPGFSSQR